MTEEQKKQVTRLRLDGCGYKKISEITGISRDNIRGFCKRHGLSGVMAQTQAGQQQDGWCRECGVKLQQVKGRKHRIFCSKECREKWWHDHPDQLRRRAVYSFVCACCGKPFTAYGNAGRKYCCHSCYIQARFKGGAGREKG